MKKLCAISVFLAIASVAAAGPITFEPSCITNNTGVCSTVLPQLHLTATDNGTFVAFNLLNDQSGFASAIAAVYFEVPDTLTGILDFAGSPGVLFSTGGSPANPPAGNNVNFDTAFYLTANSPPPQNGINPAEYLTVNIGVASGADVAGALENTRVALHLISFGGSSETILFNYAGVSSDVPAVPEPATFGLLGIALIGIGIARRRKWSSEIAEQR